MLKSLGECNFPAHAEVEILVVENGKRAGTEEICKKYPIGGRVRYIFVDAPGRSRAMNTAILASDADFLIFFDDDLRFPKNIVDEYVAAAERYGPGHFFGGPLIADAEVNCPTHLIPFLPPSAKDWSLGDNEIELGNDVVDMFFGANWAVFKNDLERVGKFSEELGVSSSQLSPLGEETVMQRELLRAGMRGIYLPKAPIYHLVQKECFTLEWIRERKARHGVTDYLLHHKNKTDKNQIFGIPAWVVRSLLEEHIRLLIAWITFAPVERRTMLQMRISYVKGIMHSALLDKKNLNNFPIGNEDLHCGRGTR
jgi:GT2 family glycosyltransferase